MRITDSFRFANSQAAIQNSLTRLNSVQRQVATGKRILQPSDAPLDASLATRLRAEQADAVRHLRSLSDARAWLSVQDSALQSASTLLTRAQDLSIQSRNASNGDNGREALAAELDGIREQLALIANTNYQGQSVFGAFSTQAISLTPTGATFNGTPGAQVQRRVSDSQLIPVNSDGAKVFGFDTADDVFAVLARLASNVRAGDDTASTADTGVLLTRAGALRGALGDVGSRAALVDSAASRHEDDKVTIASRVSEIEDVDVTEAAVKLAQASQSYEAILAMIAKSQQVSLLNFLR